MQLKGENQSLPTPFPPPKPPNQGKHINVSLLLIKIIHLFPQNKGDLRHSVGQRWQKHGISGAVHHRDTWFC